MSAKYRKNKNYEYVSSEKRNEKRIIKKGLLQKYAELSIFQKILISLGLAVVLYYTFYYLSAAFK